VYICMMLRFSTSIIHSYRWLCSVTIVVHRSQLLSLVCLHLTLLSLFFFFSDPPTPEIYTLSLHDALPI